MTQSFGITDSPTQDLHASETATNHRSPLLNAEAIGQHDLTLHPVPDSDDRKVWPVNLPGFRIQGRRPTAPGAPAEIIQRDDEKNIRIDGLARTDTMIPPTRFCIALAVETGRMMIATQSMADKDRVTSVLIELAIGFNHQVET